MILLLICAGCFHAVRDTEKEKRHLKKKSKGGGDEAPVWSPVYNDMWSPGMTPTEWVEARKPPTDELTDEPTYEPTDEPIKTPTVEPTFSPTVDPAYLPLASGNIFGLAGETPTDEAGKSDNLSTSEELDKPRYVIVGVSVAITRSLPPSGVEEKVAKVTTNVVRSYTPFVVYMLDGSRRRQLQTTDLMYEPKQSSVSLVFHGPEVTWWTYEVAYEVTKEPEEVEESLGIDDVAKSAVEGAIQSGLFQQLLTPVAPDVRGVAVPGHELDSVVSTPKATGGQPTEETSNRNRSIWLGVGLYCAIVVIIIISAFAAANRRRRRAAEAAWAISLGAQKDVGEIIRAEWNSAYCGEAAVPSEIKGAFTLGPQDNESILWEQLTADGTEDVTAHDMSLSASDGSFT